MLKKLAQFFNKYENKFLDDIKDPKERPNLLKRINKANIYFYIAIIVMVILFFIKFFMKDKSIILTLYGLVIFFMLSTEYRLRRLIIRVYDMLDKQETHPNPKSKA
ncbi:MAG: hypothetical protein A3F17_00820 [Gammaproteobacteria bacterium RIFCSPHIGHO2_12_FULL_41_15]|nr:MAG: hypothetical protein A3F17_00820 [Gammaproteobacteria bacterium RIFCSPHIGHO2_12_FULL_41_15]